MENRQRKLKFYDNFKMEMDIHVIASSKLFDVDYYNEQLGARLSLKDAIKNYLFDGYKKGYNPSMWFDNNYYLETYKDIKDNDLNPLVHYLYFGKRENRKCKPVSSEDVSLEVLNKVIKSKMFDTNYYNKQVSKHYNEANAIRDYFIYGVEKGIDPSESFSTNYYLTAYPDVKESNMNPLLHYIIYGKTEGRRCKEQVIKDINVVSYKDIREINSSGLFDYKYYDRQLKQNYTKKQAINDFLKNGIINGANPSYSFSTTYYLNQYPDIKESGINPLIHYIRYGKKEGRQPLPLQFKLQGNETGESIVEIIKKSQLFDVNYYNCVSKQSLCDEDAIMQYLLIGVEKGFDPSTAFSNYYYLQMYPDVKNNGINPLLHYIKYGRDENRKTHFEYAVNSYYMIGENHSKDISRCYSNDICSTYNENIGINILSVTKDKMNFAHNESGFIYVGEEPIPGIFKDNFRQFYPDESIMAIITVNNIDSKLTKNEPLPMNEYLENLNNISKVIFNRNKCIFRSSVKLIENSDIWENDVNFTEYILDLCAMGKIVILEDATDCKHQLTDIQTKDKILIYKKIVINYSLPDEIILSFYHSIVDECDGKYKEIVAKEMSSVDKRNPRVIISLYAFSFGGGELLPIHLANQLHNMGIPVLVHIYDKSFTDPKVRVELQNDIPVIYAKESQFLHALVVDFKATCINTHHLCNQMLVAEFYDDVSNKLVHIGTNHGMFNDQKDDDLNLIFKKLYNKVDYWTYVADKNLVPFVTHGYYERDRFYKIPNGEVKPAINRLDLSNYGIEDDAIVLCLVSRAIPGKGWKLAIEATGLARKITGKNIVLILVGDGEVYQEIKDNHPSFVFPVGFKNNPYDYINRCDIGILPSTYRGESAPLSIIEMLQCDKPVVVSDIGDVREMITLKGEMCGNLVPIIYGLISSQILADNIVDLIEHPEKMKKCAKCSSIKKSEYSLENVANKYLFVYALRGLLHNDVDIKIEDKIKFLYMAEFEQTLSPKVSVIVPNYNYARFLHRRLDCIYNQTYKNIEVIILDDHSSDESLAVINEYKEKYPNITHVIINEKQSGGVFRQWKKGIEAATGSICWIAEADDWCTNRFLETLVPCFLEPDVRIAYGYYLFARDEANINEKEYECYLNSLSLTKWKSPYINDADNEIREALGKKNTLVNASGMIFRTPKNASILNDESWLTMKICGDWEFYLNILKGGKIAYIPEKLSYFRVGDSSSASSSVYDSKIYYKEHEKIAKTLINLYSVPNDVILCHYNNVKEFCENREISKTQKAELLKEYDISSLLDTQENKQQINVELMNLPCFLISNFNGYVSNKYENSSFESLGLNTGNLIFDNAIEKQIKFCKMINLQDFRQLDFPYCGHAVLTVANLIIAGDDKECEKYFALYRKWKGQITIIGLGSQATVNGESPQELIDRLTPVRRAMIKMFAKRTVALGIRGKYTADCLDLLGIHNYFIIGCPSVYSFGQNVNVKYAKPSLSKLLISVTKNSTEGHYTKCNEKIIEEGNSYNAMWCIQMRPEVPFELMGKCTNIDDYQNLLPDVVITDKEISWIKNNTVYFFDIHKWENWLVKNSFTFAIGTRFHGNMLAFLQGIPTLWITHDSRTVELIETLHLPYITEKQFMDTKDMSSLIEKWNCDEFISSYPSLYESYCKYLNVNGIDLN